MSDDANPRVDGFTREVAGVAAGYVAIPLLTMVGTIVVTRFVEAGAILAEPGSTTPTPSWTAFVVGLGIVTAFVAGVLVAAIARTRRAAWLLAGIVLSMGLVLALPELRAEPDTADEVAVETSAGPAAFRAALSAELPRRWLLWKPALSALLVLAGAGAFAAVRPTTARERS